jgi:hypothetical protein
MEQHLKVGKLSVKNPITGVNFTVSPVIITLFFFFSLILLLKLVVASLCYIIYDTLKNPQWSNNIVSTMVVATIAICLGVFTIGLFISLLLWIPAFIMSGYNFLDMASYSIRLVSIDFWQLLSGIITPMSVTLSLLIVLTMSQVAGIIMTVAQILFYLFWIMYLQSYSMLAYFDLTKTERRDIPI